MNAPVPATGNMYLVVGYDGSAPAVRALDAATRLLAGRAGSIDVVYVAHLTTAEMLSADAVAEMEGSFDEIALEVRAQAAGQLSGREERWHFEHGHGQITDVLIEAAEKIHGEHPDDIVAIVVGSSSQAMHRIVGSVAVTLSRRAPVPLFIVP